MWREFSVLDNTLTLMCITYVPGTGWLRANYPGTVPV